MVPLTLNLPTGSVRFSFSQASAQELKAALDQLMTQLKQIASQPVGGGRSEPLPAMEYQHSGEVFLEVFCNPNIYPTPFAAKLLLTLRDDRIRLIVETELTQFLADLNQYLEEL
ncbi:MAG: hypothetical protein VKJ24_12520 [Synechococcales bacterium]|nr:hypothetical protein [Synechococcales bacterium]